MHVLYVHFLFANFPAAKLSSKILFTHLDQVAFQFNYETDTA